MKSKRAMPTPLRHLCFVAVFGFVAACGSDAPSELPGRPLSGADERTAPPAIEDARCRLATADSAAPDDCPAAGADADHDTVEDSADRCPDTTPGVPVDTTGCAKQ